MSTRNIPQLPQIRGSLKATAGHVRDRSRAVADELASLTRDEEDVRIGAAAVLQHIDDERAPLREEAGQLMGILRAALGTTLQDEEPAPADTPPATPPAQPEEPARADLPEEPPAQPDAPTAVLPAPPEPQEAIGLPPAQEVPQRPHPLDPRGWNWRRWWWLIALLTLVGLLIAAWLWDWFAQAWYFGTGPTAGWILSILHWAAWPAAGFFGGGYFSHRLEERRQRRLNQAPPPEVPVAPHNA